MSGDGFIVNVDNVPLTRSMSQRLEKLGKQLGLSHQAAIGYAAERFMVEQGELQLRIASAKRIAAAHRLNDPDGR